VPAVSAVASAVRPAALERERRLPAWWPLAALVLLAAVLRLATLDEQSFWYDEAFTPVHVLHTSLGATLRGVAHTENTPPLWYVIAWIDARILGDGEIALRLPSALAGIVTVPVVWAIGRELAGRRVALIAAAIVAVNPLLVWYSQEARAYGLFVLMAALAMLCFVRAERQPTRGRMAAFALSGALALLTHYFAVFLLIPMALWLLRERSLRRAALPAIAALALVGLALLALISAQGGHGTQWIGRWALSSRLQAIPQYYLTGYSGAPLGHGVELLVALPILAAIGLGAWRLLAPLETASQRAPAATPAASPLDRVDAHTADDASRGALRRGALIALSIAAFGVLAPVVLVAFGADYLAPRNLVGAMIPVSVLIAILLGAIDTDGAAGGRSPRGVRRLGTGLAATTVLAFLLVTVDVDLSPRLQRGNWRDVARALARGGRPRAITTVELGAAPLEYYLPHLGNLARRATVTVSEIDETGYAPLRHSAGRAPAPGFRLLERLNIDGLIVYRFVSSVPRAVSEAQLRRHVITLAHPEVLVPTRARVSATAANTSSSHPQMSSSDENI
jgi:mannosyltransferase